MKKSNKIDQVRKAVDHIDEQLLQLLAQRGNKAKLIGKLKENKGNKIYVPSRERKIFQVLTQKNKGPYNDNSIRAIFREIISATRALEQPLKVAFLGPEATFTHQAATEHFGHAAEFIAQPDIGSVFKQVEKHEVDFGVVPIENSTEGVINYTLDKFVSSDLKICSEIIIPVDLCVLSSCAQLKEVKKIYSHAHAIAQCRDWLAQHLPSAKQIHVDSTASAAKLISRQKGAAAIASPLTADFYNLNVLARKIQDTTNNYTRFLVLGEAQPGKTKRDKTSIAFVAKDKPGILYQLLKPLAEAKINLTKIESRPLKTKAWEYMFFIDLDGRATDAKIKKAFARMQQECVSFKILGTYPKA